MYVCKHILNSETMKVRMYFALTAVVCLACLGCKPEGVKLFRGDYSYETSGMMTAVAGDVRVDFPLTMNGQIDILGMDGKKDEVKVIKREMTIDISVVGGVSAQTMVYEIDAVADGDSIFFEPYVNDMTVVLNDTLQGSGKVRVTGVGVMYEDHIMIKEQYQGVLMDGDVQVGTLSAVDVRTAAERN